MKNRLRLLFVDDEEDLRSMLQQQLTEKGFAVDTADDGDRAIEILKKETYDVILLDIRMPRRSGIEVLKFIKQQKISTRVIMLTAVDDLSTALEAVRMGATDYLTKPFNLNDLLHSIQRAAST